MIPATVTDGERRYINGLDIEDFAVLDDGQPRQIQLDTADTIDSPLAVVVAVQANNTASAAVEKIQKIGSIIEPLVTGARGRAALLTFSSDLTLIQDFTNDGSLLAAAFRSIRTRSGKRARMLGDSGSTVKGRNASGNESEDGGCDQREPRPRQRLQNGGCSPGRTGNGHNRLCRHLLRLHDAVYRQAI
jgi:hypothetical protein